MRCLWQRGMFRIIEVTIQERKLSQMLKENLKTIRKAKGLSQEELAIKLYNMVKEMIAEVNAEANPNEEGVDSGNEEKPTSPVSEWGFNNLDEIGSGLVQITGYNLEEGYVYYTDKDNEGDIFKLENGFYITQLLNMDAKTMRSGYMSDYEAVNNDSFYLPGDGAFTIERREVVTDNFVLFVDDNFGYFDTFYVPYSLIDWDRGFDVYESGDGEDYKYTYKFYLK